MGDRAGTTSDSQRVVGTGGNAAEKMTFLCWDCGAALDWDGSPASAAQCGCGCGIPLVRYPALDARNLRKAMAAGPAAPGQWRYFDFLPVASPENIVTLGEGAVAVERWEFLERFAREQGGVQIEVHAHRQDTNPGTGSFKDLSGSLVAAAAAEHGVNDYVVASTGNIAAAFACYLARAGKTLWAFVPQDAPDYKQADIACFGMNVFRVNGDYTATKRMAHEFAAARGYALAAGTFDPFRIEAKKTMAYEWRRQLGAFPTVYFQALSGGTGPLGVDKGCRELLECGLIDALPRLLLVQSDRCDPMVTSWRRAEAAGFPDGWAGDYDRIENPLTEIPTLATGDPGAYPRLAPVVKESGGSMFAFPEALAPSVGAMVAYESGVRLGSAGAMGVAAAIEALRQGLLRDGDICVVNTGEGIQRDPRFLARMCPPCRQVSACAECSGGKRGERRASVWEPLNAYMRNPDERR